MSAPYTLNDLSARANDIMNSQNAARTAPVSVQINKPQWGGITWFIIFALIVGLLFFLFRPDLVLSTNTTTGQKYLDWGKLILWSIVIALVLVLIVWLAKGGVNGNTATVTRL